MNGIHFFSSVSWGNNPDQILVQLGHAIRGWVRQYLELDILVAILLSVVPIMVVFASCFALATWLERKGLARIQNRLGPNRVGPYGLLQPAADGIKMLLKEDIVPRAADAVIHFLAPILVVMGAFLLLAFLPFGRNMIAAPAEVALLLFFAIGAFSTLAIFMGGWSSRNKYSLLGAMRAVAQMISYEIPLVLSAVSVVMVVGSLNTSQIVLAQQVPQWINSSNPFWVTLGSVSQWFIFTPWGLVGFMVFFVASLAETNRSPFDLPEAESELIAGHLTEYSGFKYALFFLAEYVSMFAISGMAVTLFLGGWNGPNLRPFWVDNTSTTALVIPGFVWFFLKMFALIMVMIWVRGTFPRLRADQLMGLAWKFLVPLTLINLLVAGFYYYCQPKWVAWIVSAMVLAISYFALARLNLGPRRSVRRYHFAT